MAWNIHWQVPFTSLQDTNYMVYIYDRDYLGSVVTLTGAAHPFTTQEEHNKDIFTPVRGQSGYLRVVDETQNGDLMEQLMPKNNTERLVKLFTGSWSGSTFTPTDQPSWQGFLSAAAYSQPWSVDKKEVEMPVNSILQTLQYVNMSDNITRGYIRIGGILYSGITIGMDATVNNVIVLSDIDGAVQMMNQFVDSNIFYEQMTIVNEGQESTVMKGLSVYHAMEEVCKLFGLVMRENGADIYICQYNHAENALAVTWTWAMIQNLYNGTLQNGIIGSGIDTETLMTSIEFAGKNSKQNYLHGANTVSVEVNIADTAIIPIILPTDNEDTATVYQVPFGTPIEPLTLYGQPHTPRTQSGETYAFRQYQVESEQHYWPDTESWGDLYYYDLPSVSDYETCLAKSMIVRQNPLVDAPYQHVNYLPIVSPIITGAFPIRWDIPEEDDDIVRLESGLFLSFLPIWYPDLDHENKNPLEPNYLGGGWSPQAIYKIVGQSIQMTAGTYLNIKAMIQLMYFNGDNNTPRWKVGDIGSTSDQKSTLTCRLKVGNYYCKNAEFSKDASYCQWSTTEGMFYMHLDSDGNILNNKPTGLDIDEDKGFFIPISIDMEGDISFEILEIGPYTCVSNDGGLNKTYSYNVRPLDQAIMSVLEVALLTPNSMITVSERTSNTYYRQLMSAGFDDDKAITIEIGTRNNNLPSVSFLRQASDHQLYLESMTYRNGNNTYTQRPEMHLLDLLSDYCAIIRQTLSAIIVSEIDLIMTRYTYKNRNYIGIRNKTEWRDDIINAEFIEIL